MNQIYLSGIIKNIQPSHTIDDIIFNKANLIIPRTDGKEDIVNLKYKAFSNKYNYKNGDRISLLGNVRTYSEKNRDGSKVCVYVFTYFDLPEVLLDSTNNKCEIDGNICKISDLRTTKDGSHNIHLIIANNIENENGKRLSSYIPCIAWDKLAIELSKLKVGSRIHIQGELHSREYQKYLSSTEYEVRIAHELLIKKFNEEQ